MTKNQENNTGNIRIGNTPVKILNQYLHLEVSGHWVDVTALMLAYNTNMSLAQCFSFD
jgi:hypothetical protein